MRTLLHLPLSLLLLLFSSSFLIAPSHALLTCGSLLDLVFGVTWPETLVDTTARLSCVTGSGELSRLCCGTLSLGHVDSAGETCSLARLNTFMAVNDGCETVTLVSLAELAEALITKEGAANASTTLKEAIDALGEPRAADLAAALRASSNIIGALDFAVATSVTMEEITTWLTVKDALDLILGQTTPQILASARESLRNINAAAGVRNAAPDPIVNLAATVVDAYRYVNRLTELGTTSAFQMGLFNASLVHNRNVTAARIDASNTLKVNLPEKLLRLGIVSTLVFDIDLQARNSSDYPASAGIDVSITPYDSAADSDVADHATLPETFDVQFNRSKEAFAFGSSAGDADRRRLAASLLSLTFADINAADFLESPAEGASVSPATPSLRVWVPAGTVYDAAFAETRTSLVVEVSNASYIQLRMPLRFECRWWGDEGWATSGCTTVVDDNGDVVCRCSHMTSFAVFLTGSADGSISSDHIAALAAITYSGGGVSLICLLGTFVLFVFFRKHSWVEAHQLIIANLALALASVHVCFILAIDDVVMDRPSACQTVAILLHYFLLVSFAWMAVEGFNLYKSFVCVMDGHKVGEHGTLVRLALGAWLVPVVPVAVTAGLFQDDYGTEDYCWIDVTSNAIYGFVVPIGALCLFNLIILTMVAYTLKKNIEGRAAVRAAFAFFWLMGLGWVFGLLLLVHDHLLWRYLFAICMAVQGIFIFLTQCVANRRVRAALKDEFSSSSRKSRARSTRSTKDGSGNNSPDRNSRRASPRTSNVRAAGRDSAVSVERRITGNFNSRLSTQQGTSSPRFKLRLGSTLSETSDTPTRHASIASVTVDRSPSRSSAMDQRILSRSTSAVSNGSDLRAESGGSNGCSSGSGGNILHRGSDTSVTSVEAALNIANRVPLGPSIVSRGANPPSEKTTIAATVRPSLAEIRIMQRAKRMVGSGDAGVPLNSDTAMHLPRHLYEVAEEDRESLSRRSSNVSIV